MNLSACKITIRKYHKQKSYFYMLRPLNIAQK